MYKKRFAKGGIVPTKAKVMVINIPSVLGSEESAYHI